MRWGISIICVAAVGLVVWNNLDTSVQYLPELRLTTKEYTRIKQNLRAPTAPVAELNHQSQAEVTKCIGAASGTSLAAVFEQFAVRSQGIDSKKMLWRNIHFRLPSGVPRRVRFSRLHSQNHSEELQLQLFGEDREGLPLPLAISNKLALQARVKKYLARGETTLEQARYKIEFGNGELGEIEYENGDLVAMSLYAGRALGFSCARASQSLEIACKCFAVP